MTTPVDEVQLAPEDAISLATKIFKAKGASTGHATAVAGHLVESDRMGLPSHGLIRVKQYVDEIESGRLDPAVEPVVTTASGVAPVVDGGWTFGQVAGYRAVSLVSAAVAEHGIGFAAVRRVQHTGRLAAYTEPLAREGFVALAFATGAPRFHRVAPFGAREGRMSTNPISWAVPTDGDPLVADFSTSTMPEGRIRVLQAAGKPVPADVICDAEGRPTSDPDDFYGRPPGVHAGFLLPLGGLAFGHKGYALGLLAECFATLLAGDDTGSSDDRGNNLAILAIRGDSGLPDRATRMVEYMRSARPTDRDRPVLVPGDVERATRATSRTVRIQASTWIALSETATAAGVALPSPLGG